MYAPGVPPVQSGIGKHPNWKIPSSGRQEETMNSQLHAFLDGCMHMRCVYHQHAEELGVGRPAGEVREFNKFIYAEVMTHTYTHMYIMGVVTMRLLCVMCVHNCTGNVALGWNSVVLRGRKLGRLGKVDK